MMLAANDVSVRLRKWNSPDDRWHWAAEHQSPIPRGRPRWWSDGTEVVNQLFAASWLESSNPQGVYAVVREGRVVPLLGFGAALQPELSGYQNARLLARPLLGQRKMCQNFGRS